MRFATLLALAAALWWPARAEAQAPPPIGFWTTQDGGEQFLIQQSGQCSFKGPTNYTAGRCEWNPSGTSGILTIYVPMALGPAPIRFPIVWRNPQTFTVYSDVFYRRQ